MATSPAWRNLDPLPVLSRGKKGKDGLSDQDGDDEVASGMPDDDPHDGLSAMEDRR
jgi:hypothetical protein